MRREQTTSHLVTEENKSQIKQIVIGVMMGFAVTCVVFLAYAMLITYTQMSERSLPMVIAVTTLLSVMVAGFDAAKGATSRGWMWGMIAGFIYVAVLAIIMMVLLPGFFMDGRTFTVILLSIAGGGLGGILGINIRR
ncbi:MAG: TIGR04086 family membrane protein [Defluviitaleaceae bacterium]|nr:TIGR04086 family membrane protein [Defluviitaleaceae bacterium]